MITDNKGNSKGILPIFLIFAAAFIMFTYLHDNLRMVLIEKNFADFGHYYFWSDAIVGKQLNFYNLTDTDIGHLRDISSIPADIHIAANIPDYNPSFFILFYPFTKISFNVSSLIWLILNNVLLIYTVYLCSKFLKITFRDKYFWLAALFFIYCSQPLRENIGLGQISVLMLFLLSAQLLFIEKRKFLSGFTLALIILFKPHFAFLLIFYFIKGKYKVIASCIASFIILNFLSLIFINYRILLSHYKILFSYLTDLSISMVADNFSIYGFCGRLWSAGSFNYLIMPAYLLASMVFFVYYIIVTGGDRSKDSFALHFSAYLALFLLIAPFVTEHYLVLTFIPFLVAWRYIYCYKVSKGQMLLFLSAFLLISLRYSFLRFEVFHQGFLSILAGFKTYGLVLLYIFFINLIKKRQKLPISVTIMPVINSNMKKNNSDDK